MGRNKSTKASKEDKIAGYEKNRYISELTSGYIRRCIKRKKNPTELELFIRDNLKVVAIFAAKYANYRVDMEDLMSVGIQALIEVFGTYKNTISSKRGPYVQKAIAWKIGAYVRKNSYGVSVPINRADSEEYREAVRADYVVSFDTQDDDASPMYAKSATYFLDEETKPVDLFDRESLCNAIRSLPPYERQAIALHYIEGLTFVEIDKLVGKKYTSWYRATTGLKNLKRYYKKNKIEWSTTR